jgi:hypothetical protein
MSDSKAASVTILRGLAGGAIGGFLGYLVFSWLYQSQNLYALALPGSFLGLGAGLAAGRRCVALGILCGMLGIALGLYTEWCHRPFASDESLSYFLTHLHELETDMTLILTGLGGLFAFWFGMGRNRKSPTKE